MDLIYQCNVNKIDCRGKLPCFYHLTVPAVRGLQQGITEQNVKVPAVGWGWGPLLQMTGAYYIASDNTSILFCVM